MKYTFIFFSFILVTSCSIIDFSPEGGIKTNPSQVNQIMGENEKLYVLFEFNPEKTSAEGLLQINDYKGTIDGSISWEGSRMDFTPDRKMISGRRYTLNYSGSILKVTGGEVKSEILIPFFYQTGKSNIPSVVSESPPQGTVIARNDSIVINFSKQMDIDSVKKGFTIEPDTEYLLTWNVSDTELTITPKVLWNNITTYTFILSSDICCIENIPTDIEYSFTYYCDSSHIKPEIISLYNVLNNISLSYPRISDHLTNIKYKDGIEIAFSQTMKKESVENSLSFSPYIPGRKIWKNNTLLIFIPDSGWLWNKSYTLKISKTAESENNIIMGTDYNSSFTPDIRSLVLDSINGKPDDGFPISSFSEITPQDINTGPAAPHIYSFSFNFSEPFPTDIEKETVQSSIKLSALFPPDALSPFPVSYTWLGDSSLTIKYSGFTPYNITDNIYYYYKLYLSGGVSGIISHAGNFMLKDINQLLRTK